MPTLSSETTFEIQEKEALEESVDLILLPENDGVEQRRELHYPDDLLPPIVYQDMPDEWENFDTDLLTSRPLSATEMTLAGNKSASWPGYLGDRPVKEIWSGRDDVARMTAYQFRRIMEYFLNPPASGFIVWKPKDRTTKEFNVIIEDFSVGGSTVARLRYVAAYNELVVKEITLTLRIVSEVEEGS
jgi:hypothetical protein